MNVLDQYKEKTPEEIKTLYMAKSCSAAVAMLHLTGDFNLGTVIRNANFFGFKESFYIGGSRQWDRRSAVGTHNYIPLTHFKTIEEFVGNTIRQNYQLVALECNVSTLTVTNMFNFQWPKNSLIIVGEEGCGLPFDLLDVCDYIVEIPAFGTVRSMNVGTASGIAMSHYRSQHML